MQLLKKLTRGSTPTAFKATSSLEQPSACFFSPANDVHLQHNTACSRERRSVDMPLALHKERDVILAKAGPNRMVQV